MVRYQKGDQVQVNQIVGHGVPLPAIGTIEYEINSFSDDPSHRDWYAVRIKWSNAGQTTERLCEAYQDWLTPK